MTIPSILSSFRPGGPLAYGRGSGCCLTADRRRIESMLDQPTRCEALKTAAVAAALPAALGVQAGAAPLVQVAAPYAPRNLSAAEFRLLTALVDMIIPSSETPGAAAAGADRYIDEELSKDETLKSNIREGLAAIEKARFSSLDADKRAALLTEYSEAAGVRGQFFQLLKDLTVDGYYSSEIGLTRELGYKGNTFLQEFPGCTHEEHL